MLTRWRRLMPLTVVLLALVLGAQPGAVSRDLSSGAPCADCGPARADADCCHPGQAEAGACVWCCETSGSDARLASGDLDACPAITDSLPLPAARTGSEPARQDYAPVASADDGAPPPSLRAPPSLL